MDDFQRASHDDRSTVHPDGETQTFCIGGCMDPSFEWDPEKDSRNLSKHGVSFTEAQTVFLDPLALDAPDPDHSSNEERSTVLGRSFQGRLLLVVYTERRMVIRIISAREATRGERRAYEQGS